MAVENELVYIVRLTATGESEVIRANRVLDQTGKNVKQTNERVGTYKNTLASTGATTRKFSKQQSLASNALLDLTRIAQDAPYGIRGVANNLQQATASAARAKTAFGGWGGALKAIGGQILGPLGMVVGITALTSILEFAAMGMFSFGNKTDDAAKDAEKFLDKIKQMNDELAELKGLDAQGFFATGKLRQELDSMNAYKTELDAIIGGLNKLSNAGLTEQRLKDLSTAELAETFQDLNFFEGLDGDKARKAAGHLAAIVKKNIDNIDIRFNKGITGGSFAQFSGALAGNVKQMKKDLQQVNKAIDKTKDQLQDIAFREGFTSSQGMEAERQRLVHQKQAAEQRKALAAATNNELLQLEQRFDDKVKKIRAMDLTGAQKADLIARQTKIFEQRKTDITRQAAAQRTQIANEAISEQNNEQRQAAAFMAKLAIQTAKQTGDKKKALKLQLQRQLAEIDKSGFLSQAQTMAATALYIQQYEAKVAATRLAAEQKAVKAALAAHQKKQQFSRQFTAQTMQLQQQVAQAGMTRLQQVNYRQVQAMQKLNALKNQELISHAQYERRKNLISRQAANARVQLAQMESEQKKAAILGTAQAFAGQLQATFGKSKAIAVATGTMNAFLAGINTRAKMAEILPFPIPAILGATMTALQIAQVGKMKQVSLGGSVGGASQTVSYRGLSSGQTAVPRPAPGSGAPRPEPPSGQGGRESREIVIKNGYGNIVALGQEEIDRKGGSNYLRGQ